MLSPVGSSFAVACASSRKIITAFQNIALPEPAHHTADVTEAYYVVQQMLNPRQPVDDRAIPMVYKGVGDPQRDWAILDVADSSRHVFADTLPLRSADRPLPSSMVETSRLQTVYYKHLFHRVVSTEITATDFDRVDHVYSKTVELSGGLCIAATGAPLIDKHGGVACLHRKNISEAPRTRRIRMSDTGVVIEVSCGDPPQSRIGSTIFDIPALINDLL